MKIVNLKISPLSKKILLAEYPAHEPSSTIVAGSHTLLYRQLMAQLPLRRQRTDVLTDVISVAVANCPDLCHDDLMMIGLMIHQEHRYASMRWIQATVAAGETASHGIRTFFDHYELEDEDLNYETVFRQWQRYVRKNTDLLSKPKGKILDAKDVKKTGGAIDEPTFEWMIADIIEYMYVGDAFRYRTLRNLRLLVSAMTMTVKEMGGIYNLSEQGVYSALQSARKWVAAHAKVRAVYLKYYGVDAASSQHDHKGHRVDKIPLRT
jgi:hypothetical protein